MPKFIYLLCIFCTLMMLSACDDKPHKTYSMLVSEAAYAEVDSFVERASHLLSPSVIHAPESALDDIVLANSIVDDAIAVFDNKNIRDWEHQELQTLLISLDSLQPRVASHALALLDKANALTNTLRLRIEELKYLPYGVVAKDTDKMVQFLSKEYNEDLLKCCLIDLGRSTKVLRRNPANYHEIIWLSNNIYRELGKVIRAPEAGIELGNKIQQLRHNLSKNQASNNPSTNN